MSGVVLGLFIIPVLFVVFQHLQERISGVPFDRHRNKNADGSDKHVDELQPEMI